MDPRSFTAGIVCGAAIGAIVVTSLGDSGGNRVDSELEHSATAGIVPHVTTVARPVEDEPREPPASGQAEVASPQPSNEASVGAGSSWTAQLRAELELEQKDSGWAYYMEQTLLQFLSGHSSIDQFDITRIECRTSRCQIEVIGFSESTAPVWQQVMYDIGQQPWSEFGHSGTSSGFVDDRFTLIGTLRREMGRE